MSETRASEVEIAEAAPRQRYWSNASLWLGCAALVTAIATALLDAALVGVFPIRLGIPDAWQSFTWFVVGSAAPLSFATLFCGVLALLRGEGKRSFLGLLLGCVALAFLVASVMLVFPIGSGD